MRRIKSYSKIINFNPKNLRFACIEGKNSLGINRLQDFETLVRINCYTLDISNFKNGVEWKRDLDADLKSMKSLPEE